jgi:hypothetical protein
MSRFFLEEILKLSQISLKFESEIRLGIGRLLERGAKLNSLSV